jgi:hypothetical protein
LRTGSKVREAKSSKSEKPPADKTTSTEPKWRFLSYVLDVP